MERLLEFYFYVASIFFAVCILAHAIGGLLTLGLPSFDLLTLK